MSSGSIIANAGIAPSSGGALEFNDNATLLGGTLSGTRSIRFNGGTLSITGTPTIQDSTFELFAGTISGTGSVATDGGILLWTNGTVQQLTIAKNAAFVIAGKDPRDMRNITNNGSTVWSGGNIRGLGNAVWNNAPGSTFLDVSKASFLDYNGGNTFKNAGTFTTGVQVGKTTMTWGFNQSSTGVLAIDVNSATGFDQYSIGGAATLAGTLQIVHPSNFLRATGSKFKFLMAGKFATVKNTIIDSTRSFQVQYNPSDVPLVVASKTTRSVNGLTNAHVVQPGIE